MIGAWQLTSGCSGRRYRSAAEPRRYPKQTSTMQSKTHFATKSLHRSLYRLCNYTHLPLTTPPSTAAYVDSLASLCSEPSTGLFELLLSLKDNRLDDAIMNATIPADLFASLMQLRSQRDQLQIAKEKYLVSHDFDAAKDCLVQQRSLDATIAQIAGGEIPIMPSAIVSALRRLGYTEPLPGHNQSLG